MRDALTSLTPRPVVSEDAQAEALHAMGSFYVRQGFPKQGLALLLAAHKFAVPSLELNRAIAHAYVLAGVPQKALAMLDALGPTLEGDTMRPAADRAEAKTAFAASMQQAEEEPPRKFKVTRRGQ